MPSRIILIYCGRSCRILKINDYKAYIRNQKRNKIIIHASRILLFALFIFLWEILSTKNIIDPFIFSSPKRIINCINSLSKNNMLYEHLGITVYETLLCFLIVMLSSLCISIILWLNKNLFAILEPTLIMLNSIPKSALAPLLIVWLGNNTKTIITAAASVSIFGSILNIYTAFNETDPNKIKMLRTLGAKKHHILFYLIIPSSLPTILSTMKVNLGLSLVGVIIGEFLAAKKGLGYLIIYGSQVFKMDWVLTSITILSLLSIILYWIINFFEKKKCK